MLTFLPFGMLLVSLRGLLKPAFCIAMSGSCLLTAFERIPFRTELHGGFLVDDVAVNLLRCTCPNLFGVGVLGTIAAVCHVRVSVADWIAELTTRQSGFQARPLRAELGT